jgi:hypothetical protein
MFRQPPMGYFKPFFRTARLRRKYAGIRYDELDSIRTCRNAQLRKSRSQPPNARGITYWSMVLFSWHGVSCDHGSRLRLLHARACDTFVVRSGDGGVVLPRDGGSDPMARRGGPCVHLYLWQVVMSYYCQFLWSVALLRFDDGRRKEPERNDIPVVLCQEWIAPRRHPIHEARKWVKDSPPGYCRS